MRIVIASDPKTPTYEQIYRQISSQILNGELLPDEMLPSIRNVAKETGISVITVKTAWEKLLSDGLIYSIAGKGCFVARTTDSGDKKLAVVSEKLLNDLQFYRKMNVSKRELIDLIDKMY